MKKIKVILILLLIISTGRMCLAEMSTPNYKITSDVIGGFGTKESSTSFELGDTGGEMGTGDSQSTSYNLSAGFWATVGDNEILIFNITDPIADLGTLSDMQVKYDTAAFNAASTAQGGYVIQYFGGSLDSGAHIITPLSSPSGSSPGNEQFGFNLRANNFPPTGINPTGGYGQANSDYYMEDKFKFSSGDTIADSSRPSGQTNYVASFIGNVDESSIAGSYATSITVIVTGRY
jgi:hypothetical protein